MDAKEKNRPDIAMMPDEFIQTIDQIFSSVDDKPPSLLIRLFSSAARKRYKELERLKTTAERTKKDFIEQFLLSSAPQYAKAEENASKLRALATQYKTYIELATGLTRRHAEEIGQMFTAYSQVLKSIRNSIVVF